MSDSTLTFMEDRRLFFSSPSNQCKKAQSLAFLSRNHDEFEKEKAILKATLDTLKIKIDTVATDDEKEKYRLFYLYCCDSLKTYHASRGESKKSPKDWENALHDSLGYIHCFRILLSFARITDELLIRMLNDAGWFETLNRSIAPIFDFDQAISILNLPVETFYILSFSVLGLRFILECARILKHTFNPTDQELKALSAWERFSHEIYKYRFNIANDIVWGVLNAINNNPLMLVCVLFDLSILLHRQRITQHTYLERKGEYEQILARNKQDKVMQQQLKELQLNHIETSAILKLALMATADILIGLSLLLTAPVPIAAPIGAFICVIGFAAYLSLDNYGDYQKQTHRIKQLETDGKGDVEITKAKQAQQAAWQEGWSTFTKNVALPVFFIGALAICWPVAALVITAYVAIEMFTNDKAQTAQLSPT
ncbi:MAG: hypothetical protein K0U37_04990 [Gammaproteobacteria bacterium]|nr:hypothetical protein [Gammaproteobacteria bacterium]